MFVQWVTQQSDVSIMIDVGDVSTLELGVCCNKGHPSETRLETLIMWNLVDNNLDLISPIILKFCTDHGDDIAMFCAKFQNDWVIKMDVMDG